MRIFWCFASAKPSSEKPPTNRQIVRKVKGAMPVRASFMAGQFTPQNSVSSTSSTKPLAGRGEAVCGAVIFRDSVKGRLRKEQQLSQQ